MPRRAAKKDSNHNTIAAVLVGVGCEVVDTSALPGALDLVCAYRGVLTWLEIKQPHTRNDLTDLERKTIARLRRVDAPVFVVCSEMEALKAVGAI